MPTGVYQRSFRPVAERLWARVDKSGDCWVWTGPVSREQPYGRIKLSGRHGRYLQTHRISYELAFGPIPNDLWVLHHCDNPPCVRPDHLYVGTREDNTRDAHERGRYAACADGARRAAAARANARAIRCGS